MAKKTNHRAISLVEVVIAILALSWLATGLIKTTYFAVHDATKSDMRDTAARLALMLSDAWRAADGNDTTFNLVDTVGGSVSVSYPTNHIVMYLDNTGGNCGCPPKPAVDFNDFNKSCYTIRVPLPHRKGGVSDTVHTYYWARLSYKYVADPTGYSGLKLTALNVTIQWGPRGAGQTTCGSAGNQNYSLTTYAVRKW